MSIIEQIQGKLLTKYFFKFKNPTYSPFPQIWGQENIFLKIRLSCTTSQGFLILCQIKRNLMIHFRGDTMTDVRTEGWENPIS